MPDWSRVETRRRTAPGPPGWGLGGGSITRSRKKKHITGTETRITSAPYREAGVQDANTRLKQRAKQRMTHKPPMKLLLPKACVKIGQWNVRTLFEVGKCAEVIKEMQKYGISILKYDV